MKVPKNKVKKRTSITDIYLHYPYKATPPNNTIPKPYYPKSEYTNHNYSLTLAEWRKIIHCYFNNITEYLLTGKGFNIPERLGFFQIFKIKNKNVYKNYNVKVENLPIAWGDLTPMVKWKKPKVTICPEFIYSYNIKLTKEFKQKLHKYLIQDKDNIYIFLDKNDKNYDRTYLD